MGGIERRLKEKEMHRSEIVDAAEKVFFSLGYEKATMDDIAKEAEFSKRTIYVYFNSKEQLYFAVMVRGYGILISMMEKTLSAIAEQDVIQQLKALGITLFRFKQEYPNYFYAIMEYENGERDFFNDISDESKNQCYLLGEKLFGYLTSALKRAKDSGQLKADLDLTDTALFVWASAFGLFNIMTNKKNYIKHYHGRNSDELIVKGLDFLIDSITR